MSEFLHTLENEVQLFALTFLGIVYILKITWLMRFRFLREKTFPEGSTRSGIWYSIANVAMPWAMESTRKHIGFYIQFVIFHLGVIFAITATFIIPYAPQIFESQIVVVIFQIITGAAFLVGLVRLQRRVFDPAVRIVSTKDDYFSLTLMTLYFASAVLAIPNRYKSAEWPLMIFFGLTAVFLIYVPFSKICHYLYYPFTRYFLGRTLGHRGVIAKKRSLSDLD